MAAPTILILPEAFGVGVDVQVVPPPFGVGHDAEFHGYDEAVSYALRLQRATGWRLVDHCGEPAHDGR